MKKRYKLLMIMVFLVISFMVVDHIPIKGNSDYSNIDLANINKLMIVAHPDDEIFWGGGHLLTDDYLVVCITCGQSRLRVKEFKKSMQETHDAYIMLDYPDEFLGIRSKWHGKYNAISSDLEHILKLKNWDMVVTHNPDGEYGHIQHIITSQIVSSLYDNDNLYYFGKYYDKKELIKVENDLDKLPNDIYKRKMDILSLYNSQFIPQFKHQHMTKYENWVKASSWS